MSAAARAMRITEADIAAAMARHPRAFRDPLPVRMCKIAL